MKKLFLLLLIPVLVLLNHCIQQTPAEFDLAVTNVTLIDGTGSEARPNRNIYILDGKIARISEGEPKAPVRKIIDGSGQFLMPGLIDGHAHPFPIEENFPRFIHYGVTSIFIPGGSDCSNENLTRARALSASDSIASPAVYHTSQHFTMEGRHPVKTYQNNKWVEGKTVYYLRDTLSIAAMVEEVARQPIRGIKLTIEDGPEPPFVDRIPLEFVAKVVQEAHRRNLKVFAHVSDIEEVRIAEAAGVDHLVHFVGVDIDWPRDGAMITRLLRRDPSWVTTLMLDKSFFYPAFPQWLAEIEKSGIFSQTEIDHLRQSTSPEASRSLLEEIYMTKNPTLDGILTPQMEDLNRLHEMGFNLVIGTDTGNDFIFPGLSMHEEMELMARGFSPLEIIKMATLNTAKMLSVQDSVGSLVPGMAADMILLEKNPLEDIANTRAIRMVFRGGKIQPRLNTDVTASQD